MNTKRVMVWDAPLRLFHWGLLVCVMGCIVTIQLGADWMDWHARFGYGAAGLLAFRLLWGFIGTHHSRFSSFSYRPSETVRYARGQSTRRHLGHNPLGALSVFAMLTVLGFQAISGFFTSDDIFFEGPLAHLIASSWVSTLTGLHKSNQWLIYGLIGMHVGAVLFYTLVKREALISAMVHGRKSLLRPPHRPSRRPARAPGHTGHGLGAASSMFEPASML